MAKAMFADDAMAAERVLGSSLKLLAFLFTVVFIIQDNVITFKKQDPGVPQTVSTSLEVLGLASHSMFLALRVQYTVKATSSFNLQRNLIVYGDILKNSALLSRPCALTYSLSATQRLMQAIPTLSSLFQVTLSIVMTEKREAVEFFGTNIYIAY